MRVVTCTWKDCTMVAVREETDRNGKVWASLCSEHGKELDDAVMSMNPKVLLKSWILAKGGAKKVSQS